MLGLVFIYHGSQKVLGIFGGLGLEGFAAKLAGYGIPAALAYFASFAELTGGLLLVLGCYTWIGALLSLVAVVIIHWPDFFIIGSFEYPLVLLVSTVAVLLGAPCVFSRSSCTQDECASN